jgi:hypothetical protein
MAAESVTALDEPPPPDVGFEDPEPQAAATRAMLRVTAANAENRRLRVESAGRLPFIPVVLDMTLLIPLSVVAVDG